jgi:hypothetical protein
VLTGLFLDECGGHAQPYHYHADLVCEYNKTTGVHSRATGVALDGAIIYGVYETGTTAPTDLDRCNGHVGPVPSDEEYALQNSTVYHYHMTVDFPHTMGCFGPVASEVRRRRAALYCERRGMSHVRQLSTAVRDRASGVRTARAVWASVGAAARDSIAVHTAELVVARSQRVPHLVLSVARAPAGMRLRRVRTHTRGARGHLQARGPIGAR